MIKMADIDEVMYPGGVEKTDEMARKCKADQSKSVASSVVVLTVNCIMIKGL